MATSTGSQSDQLLDQLSTALAESQTELHACEDRLQAAKAACVTAKERVKTLTRLIAMYQGQGSGPTKDSLRPQITALLRNGPLPEEKLSKELLRVLREKSLPHAGLTLVLRALRPEFVDSKGLWNLADSQEPDRAESGHA